MQTDSVLSTILQSFSRYYDINTENPVPPFVAEAVFHSHNEQFFLVKAAKIAQIDSNEYAFFATIPLLSQKTLEELCETAWETGLSRVKVSSNHRNSDVTLVIVAEKTENDAFLHVKKIHHHKSYRFGFLGWSDFRVILLENSSGRVVSNRAGRDFQKIFKSIKNK